MEKNACKTWLLFVTFLSVAFLAGLSAVSVHAEARDIRKIVAYEAKEDGIYITGLKENAGVLSVPETIDGIPVVSIRIGGDGWDIGKLDVRACSSLRELVCSVDIWQGTADVDASGLPSLEILDLRNSTVRQLDMEGCTGLKELRLYGSSLQMPELVSCPSLRILQVEGTGLGGRFLDLSGCPALEEVYLSGTGAGGIGLGSCPELRVLKVAWEAGMGELDLGSCPRLETLSMEQAGRLRKLDITGCGQLVEVTCRNTGIESLDLSGREQLKSVDCFGEPLSELRVDGCGSLEKLYMARTLVTELCVPESPLKELYCMQNQLGTLELPDFNGQLKCLDCTGNRLTTLNAGECPVLYGLYCEDNRICGELDLDGCSMVKNVYCANNQIEKIKFGRAADSIEDLRCARNRLRRLDLDAGEGQLENLDCSNNQITKLNLKVKEDSLLHLDCSNNRIRKLDLVPEKGREDRYDFGGNPFAGEEDIRDVLKYEKGKDGIYITGLKKDVEELSVPESIGGLPVVSIRLGKHCSVRKQLDVHACTYLRELSCRLELWPYHEQQDLDLSGLKYLKILDIFDSEAIGSLDLSGCTGLEELCTAESGLGELDVTHCAALRKLTVGDMVEGYVLDLNGCPELESLCVEYSGIGGIRLENCRKLKRVFMYDTEYLGELDLGHCTELESLELNLAHSLRKVDVSGCRKLENVACEQTGLQSLDLRGKKRLKYLKCTEGQLRSLDIDGCSRLEGSMDGMRFLDVRENRLKELRVPKCRITKVECAGNWMENLELGEQKEWIREIFCSRNRIKALDLNEYRSLEFIDCDDNQINGMLDLSSCKRLESVKCNNNLIEELRLGTAAKNLMNLSCSNNRLKKLDLNVKGSQLKVLDCRNNRIKKLKLDRCRNLKWLKISGNPCAE